MVRLASATSCSGVHLSRGDRGFESCSLQRRVRDEPLPPSAMERRFEKAGPMVRIQFPPAVSPVRTAFFGRIPSMADPAGGLEGAHIEAELAQTINRVKPANSGANDDCIEPRGSGVGFRRVVKI